MEADFNHDDIVDGSDLTAWESAYGIDAGADEDGDGDTDGADSLIWQRSFGNIRPTGAATTLQVPEPNGVVLAVCGALGALCLTQD